MAKAPISDFYNLLTMSNAVLWGSINNGPAFRIRPGHDKDLATSPETLLWRYMPKKYFLDMLATKSLFFTRLTHHHSSDPFEGSISYAASQMLESVVVSKGGDVQEFRATREAVVKKFLRVVLINCWHERMHENRQMWDRYGKSGVAVAVVTSFGALRESLAGNVDVGHVDYIDIATQQPIAFSSNPSFQAFFKRQEYEDEREVRAMIFDWPLDPPKFEEQIPISPGTEIGYRIPVQLETLIQRVVISPDSPSILTEIRAATSAASLNVAVESSSLIAPVRY